VTHYTQNLDRENWTEYASSQIIGDIGEYYTEKPMDISGFTYDHIEYVVNGQKVPADQITSEGVKLTEAGLEINLYYVRNEYPYIVRYLEQGTGTVLAEQKDSKGLYSDVVSESAIDIEHYTKLEPTTQTLSIRIDGELNPDGSIKTYPTLNIITFYYKENETQINYEIVGPVDGCGTIALNRNSSVSTNQLDTPISETNIPVLNGDAIGSTATANAPTFKFVGWYSDEACTQLVSADANFQPQKPDSGVWAETTYYAKFDYNIADLTIVKTIDKPDANTADDVFTFKVTLPEGTYAHDNATPDNTADDGTIVTTAQNPTAQIQITGQGALTIKGIVITSGYTVEEIDLPDGYAIANNPVTGTIAAGANTAAFANTYTTGQLIISKTVAGESAPTGDAADTFSYSVTLPKGTYAVAGMAGVTELVFAEGETKQFTFKHGDSVTISGIPTGADYTVTETAHEDYTVAPQSGAYTGDIAAETKAPFVNTFKYSDLLIHKDFSDNNASAKTLYKITAPDGYSQIVSITGEGSVLIDNLKVGVTYTIKELDTWSWRYTCADDEQEAMIVAEDTAEVTFVNTKKNDKWLDGEDSNENVFDAKTTN